MQFEMIIGGGGAEKNEGDMYCVVYGPGRVRGWKKRGGDKG